MAIRNIGGQSVYVIEAQPIAAAKTSTGAGYAQLVSQLRWQIWEEAQRQILRELEFEKMGYEAQLDSYVKQKQELTRALTKARELKEKVARGDVSISQAISLANADASVAKANQAMKLKLGTEKISEKPAVSAFTGKPTGEMLTSFSYTEPREGVEFTEIAKPSSRIGQISKQLGVDTPDDRKAAAVAAADAKVKGLQSEWMNLFKTSNPQGLSAEAWSQSPEGKEIEKKLSDAKIEAETTRGTPASQFKSKEDQAGEAELDDFVSQLQAQIDTLEAPKLGFDTNVLSRTREQFGGMAGVGGFGFAPRPSKISPIYDEGRAKEALARFQPAAEDVILESAAQKAADQEASILSARNQRALELQAAGAPQEQIDALKTLTNEEKTAIQRAAMEIAQKEFRESALSAGPGPRTAGTFMDRPRPEAVARPDFVRQKREKREKKERDFKFPEFKGLDLFQYPDGSVPSTSFGLTGTAESGLGFSGGPIYGGSGAGGENLVDIELLKDLLKDESIRPSFDIGAFGEAGLGFEPPKPEPKPEPIPVPKTLPPEPKVSADDDKKIGAEQAEKEFAIQYGPVKQGTSEMIPVDPKINRKIYEAFLQEAPFFPGTQQESDAAGRAWYQGKLDEFTSATPAQGRAKPKTRTEKYASSSLAILKKGSDLADKPSKLARLAKLDLPEKERSKQVPEHILLVDKLYQINKGKTNAYKSTFDEIARVYSKDDKKKKEAQEYLTATHLLYTEGLV